LMPAKTYFSTAAAASASDQRDCMREPFHQEGEIERGPDGVWPSPQCAKGVI
jgi:hypothetical protein